MSKRLKVWSEDEGSYLDYEDEDEFFLVRLKYRRVMGHLYQKRYCIHSDYPEMCIYKSAMVTASY